MNDTKLLRELHARGVKLRMNAHGDLTYTAPASGMTVELLSALHENAAAVARRLQARPRVRVDRPPRSHRITDPLVDLDPDAHSRDGALWGRMLHLAWPIDGRDPSGTFGVLRGLRCLGAQLEDAGDEWRLRPPADWTRAELTESMGAHAALVVDLLTRAAQAEPSRTVRKAIQGELL